MRNRIDPDHVPVAPKGPAPAFWTPGKDTTNYSKGKAQQPEQASEQPEQPSKEAA